MDTPEDIDSDKSENSLRHKAFSQNPYSQADRFVSLKKNDEHAKLFLVGSYAWAPDTEVVYEPSKVVKQIEYSPKALKEKARQMKLAKAKQLLNGHMHMPSSGQSVASSSRAKNRTGLVRGIAAISSNQSVSENGDRDNYEEENGSEVLGKVVVERENAMILKNVTVKSVKQLLPLQEEHLTPSNFFTLDTDDLSKASLLHNLRFQFDVQDVDCLQIEEKTMIYMNRFLNSEQMLQRKVDRMMQKMALKNQPKAEQDQLEDAMDDEPERNVETFAETIYEKMLGQIEDRKAEIKPLSCTISGNADSNRRQMCKDFVRRVVQLANPKDADWFEKLSAADEVLGIFGGERFLRWTELHINAGASNSEEDSGEEGKLIGAEFRSFLLDTSNITNKESFSFSVFYQILGNPEDASKYFYLNRGQVPEYSFTPEEVKEYNTTPEEREFLKRKAEEAKLEEQRLAKEQLMLKMQAEKAEEDRQKALREKSRIARQSYEAQRKASKTKPGNVLTRLQKLQEAQEQDKGVTKKNRKICEYEGCEKEVFDSGVLCVMHLKAKNEDPTAGASLAEKLNMFNKAPTPESRPLTKGKHPGIAAVTEEVKKPTLGSLLLRDESKQQEHKIEEESRADIPVIVEGILESEPDKAAPDNAKLIPDDISLWSETVEKLKTLNVMDEEITAMVEILTDMLEIGNIQVQNNQRPSNKAAAIDAKLNNPNVIITDTASDDEKDEDDIQEKNVDVNEIWSPKKANKVYKTLQGKATGLTADKGAMILKGSKSQKVRKDEIPDVEVAFLVETKRVKPTIFGCNLIALVDELNKKRIKVGIETFARKLGKNRTLARRDALVRALYNGLFNWLFSIINRGVSHVGAKRSKEDKAKESARKVGIIAVLETIGLITELEDKGSSSLEMLINNFAEEKLHVFHTLHILESFSNQYAEDNISVQFTPGNELVLPLILGKHMAMDTLVGNALKDASRVDSHKGIKSFNVISSKANSSGNRGGVIPLNADKKQILGILNIAEEQLISPKGSDKNLISRIEAEHKQNPKLLLSPRKYTFTIQHFGAEVTYRIKGFVKKTMSAVLDDQIANFVIENTTNQLVKKCMTKFSSAKQQENLQKIYDIGMSHIRKELSHAQTDAVSHVPSQESNFTRNTAPTGNFPAVGGGMIGMTMTFNLAGILRSKNNTHTETSAITVGSPVQETFAMKQKARLARIRNEESKAKANGYTEVVEGAMKTLIVLLDLSDPHFIKCIPTNAMKLQNKFDPHYILDQLRICGVTPFFVDRLQQCVFGEGTEFEVFKQVYSPLKLVVQKSSLSNPTLFMKNLTELGVLPQENWRVGASGMIYLKLGGTLFDIQTLTKTAYEDVVVYLQKNLRMRYFRKLFWELLEEKLIDQIKDASAKNNLLNLLTAVSKATFYNLAFRERTVAQGKILRLQEELKMRNLLKKVADTPEVTITQLYAVLQKAKDSHLPYCEELQFATDKYNELNALAEKNAKQEQEKLKRRFANVVTELKEDQEFHKNFDIDDFVSDLKQKRQQEEAEHILAKQAQGPSKLDKIRNNLINARSSVSLPNLDVDEDNDEDVKLDKAQIEGIRYARFNLANRRAEGLRPFSMHPNRMSIRRTDISNVQGQVTAQANVPANPNPTSRASNVYNRKTGISKDSDAASLPVLGEEDDDPDEDGGEFKFHVSLHVPLKPHPDMSNTRQFRKSVNLRNTRYSVVRRENKALAAGFFSDKDIEPSAFKVAEMPVVDPHPEPRSFENQRLSPNKPRTNGTTNGNQIDSKKSSFLVLNTENGKGGSFTGNQNFLNRRALSFASKASSVVDTAVDSVDPEQVDWVNETEQAQADQQVEIDRQKNKKLKPAMQKLMQQKTQRRTRKGSLGSADLSDLEENPKKNGITLKNMFKRLGNISAASPAIQKVSSKRRGRSNSHGSLVSAEDEEVMNYYSKDRPKSNRNKNRQTPSSKKTPASVPLGGLDGTGGFQIRHAMDKGGPISAKTSVIEEIVPPPQQVSSSNQAQSMGKKLKNLFQRPKKNKSP